MGEILDKPLGGPNRGKSGTEVGLQIIFAQYDQKKYPGSLERLIGFLTRFERFGYSLLVVDNARPESFAHRLDSRITHIGGDNSSWEFSAFDRGLAYLDGIGTRAKVYGLVTDAFTAYGDAFLSLIDPAFLPFAADRRVAIGWFDGWPDETAIFGKRYRDWMRTSFALLSREALAAVRPLTPPLDRAALFSSDPAQPFAANAPLEENLKRYITEWLVGAKDTQELVEGWHSRFRLDRESLPFFEKKAMAILREHLLSVRLREASIPCYDFRLLQRVLVSGLSLDRCDRAALASFEGTRFNAPDDGRLLPTTHGNFDVAEVPVTITHGDPAEICLTGWVLSRPQPAVVHLRVGAVKVAAARCTEPRDDVARAYPVYGTTDCGFKIRTTLPHLALGRHEVVLEIDADRKLEVGSIEVLPAFSFVPRRSMMPESWPARRSVPFSIEGELLTSQRAVRVRTLIDGKEVNGDSFVSEGAVLEHGLFIHEVSVNGSWTASEGPSAHVLELAFELSLGETKAWVFPFNVVATDVMCTLRSLVVGPYDPDTGLSTVALDMDVFDAEPGDRIVLEREGAEICDRIVVDSGTTDFIGPRRIALNFERLVQGLPPGNNRLSLLLRRGHRRSLVWQGDMLVRFRYPEIHVEQLTATLVRADEPSVYRLHIAGWVKNHFLVDCLIIEIDGSRAAIIGLHALRPDVAKALGNPLVTRQGFDADVEVTSILPGHHAVHVIATQRDGERARVTQRVAFEEAPSRRLSVASDDLERLLQRQEVQFYSAITIRGVVTTEMEHAVATLLIGDRLADEHPFDGPGSHEFSLRAVPALSGEYDVRFMVSSRGRVVFATDPVRVAFRTLELADTRTKDLAALLDRFDLRSKIIGRPGDRELVSRLIESQPERIPEFIEMLADCGRRIRAANPSRRSTEPTALNPHRRLKILFVSWEVPSRYHGGGVYLVNLLARLGELHDVTLVHTYGIDEVGHSRALQRYMKRIIPVARIHSSAKFRGDGRLPNYLYHSYIPELRRVIELELASGAYDLVDYEYAAMAPYVVPAVPSVLTVHETGYTALLNSEFASPQSVESTVQDLDHLVREFHFCTSALPSLCHNLITLTEEDASAITTFSDASVYTNPGGVDIDESQARQPSEPGASPVLAYIGGFQHPPNTRAARFFALEVMPELRLQYPNAEFRIYGSKIPPLLQELDGKHGVRVLGFVDDVRSALRAATAMVAPIFTGTGMRMKVLEALGAGALVIGTDLSMRGLAAVDRRHFYRANTATEFIRAIERAVERPEEAQTIAQAGQALVAKSYSWDSVVRRREAIWHRVLGDAEEDGAISEAGQATAE